MGGIAPVMLSPPKVLVDAGIRRFVSRVRVASLVPLHELGGGVEGGPVRAEGESHEGRENRSSSVVHVLLRGFRQLAAEKAGVLGRHRGDGSLNVRIRQAGPLYDDILQCPLSMYRWRASADSISVT